MNNNFKKWTWNLANEGVPQAMFDEHNEAVKDKIRKQSRDETKSDRY